MALVFTTQHFLSNKGSGFRSSVEGGEEEIGIIDDSTMIQNTEMIEGVAQEETDDIDIDGDDVMEGIEYA